MREKEKSTSIVYVRHGKADFPYDRLYCDDREDPPLAEEGARQARSAARSLQREQDVDLIYASPMLRTRTTAEAIAAATGAPLSFHAGLKERPFGIWDGLYFDEIARDFPEGFQAWKRDPVEFVPEGGETIRDHHKRVTAAVAEIIQRHPGQTICVVAHVGPIRMCITDALGMPLAGYRQLTIDYGSLSRVDYGKRQSNLIYMNLYERAPNP